MGSLHLCEGSFISPEEGVAELRMEEGIEYVGGWKGRVGFDPLPTVSPSQLSRSLFRVGGMAGAGRLSVDSSCTVPHLPSPLSLSPGEEYAGNFRDSLPHGMGRWVKRSVRDDGSVVRTETICYFSAGKANGPALVVKGVYASKEEEEEDKLVEGVFDALLPRRRQGGSSSRRGGGGGEGGMSGERGREGRGGAKGGSRKVECYHFDMGKKGMKTVLLWPFVFSLLLTFGVKMNEVYRVGAKTRRVKRECGYVASKKEGGGKGGKGRHEADVPKLQKPSIENSLFGWYLPAFLMSWFYVHEEVEMGAFGWVYLVIGSLPLPLLLMSEQVRVLSKSKDDYQNPLCMTNFFWSTMASWFSLFMLRLYSLLPPHLTPLTAAFLFFFFGTAASFVWARRADPGYLPRRHHPLTQAEIAELRQGGMLSKVCITCAIHKPPRSKHCKHCDRCVDILDHHCGALSHCVGSQNRISFITYVFLLDVAMVLYAVLVLKFASYKVHASAEVGISEWIGKIFSLLFRYHFTLFCHLIWIALFLVMYLSLLADHVRMVLQNITTNESLNWKKYSYLQKPKGKKGEGKGGSNEEDDRDGEGQGSSQMLSSIRSLLHQSEEQLAFVSSLSPLNSDGTEMEERGELNEAFVRRTNLRIVAENVNDAVDVSSTNKGRHQPSFFNPYNRGIVHNVKTVWRRKVPYVKVVEEGEDNA